jgi:hypothetical protein
MMPGNDYHFITNWRVESTMNEIYEIIADGPGLPRWWPSVYLGVEELEPGDKRGLGRVIGLYTKGWLPYTLRWQFRVIEERYPYGFTLQAWGDFTGRGIWTFDQDGKWVNITYDWKIRADKPLLRYFSFIMKPVFSANHRWAMSKGEESLRLELARRHARSPDELALVPAPPPATPTSPVPLALAAVSLLGLFGAVMYRLSRRKRAV